MLYTHIMVSYFLTALQRCLRIAYLHPPEKYRLKQKSFRPTFIKSYFKKLVQDKFDIVISLLVERLKLPNQLLYFDVHILCGRDTVTDHFLKRSKYHQLSLGPISPWLCTLKSCRAECKIGKRLKHNSFLNSFRQWPACISA